jgi:hypothetical protein
MKNLLTTLRNLGTGRQWLITFLECLMLAILVALSLL